MGKFAELCELLPAEVNWGDPITPDIVEQIVLAEREACAKIAEQHEEGPGGADAIRMRSNVKYTP